MDDEPTQPGPSATARALYLLVSILFWFGLVFGTIGVVISLASYLTAPQLTVGLSSTIPELIEIPLVLVALWILRGLAGSVRIGTPFTTKNVRRLRTLALIAVVGFPGARLVGVVM